jgi:hypothetical protein
MGKKTKTPKAPDYTGVANQQTALNKKAWEEGVQANRPNQIGPSGSSTWAKDPTTGQWTQTQSFNPQQQDVFNQQWGNQGTLAGKTAGMMGGLDTSQIDLGQAPGMPEVAGDFDMGNAPGMPGQTITPGGISTPEVGGYNQQAIDTMRALQAPGLQRQRAAKEAQLAAMGLGTGSGQAWNAEQQNLGETANNADLQAILAGINQGNIEFGQGMDRSQFDLGQAGQAFNQGMGLRQQGMSEEQARIAQENAQFGQGSNVHQQGVEDILNQRAGNLQQLQGMFGLGQNPQLQFGNVGNVGTYNPGDLMGATQQQYQANLDKTNAKNADKSNNMSALGSVASIGATIF